MPPKKGRCKLHLNPPGPRDYEAHAEAVRGVVGDRLQVPGADVEVLYDVGLVAELTTPTIDREPWPEGEFAAALRDLNERDDLHNPAADSVRVLFEPNHRSQLEPSTGSAG